MKIFINKIKILQFVTVVIIITLLFSSQLISQKFKVNADTETNTSEIDTSRFTITEDTHINFLLLGNELIDIGTIKYVQEKFPESLITINNLVSSYDIDSITNNAFENSKTNDLNIIYIACHGNQQGDIFLNQKDGFTTPLINFLKPASECKGHTLIITTACYSGLNIISEDHKDVTNFLDKNRNLTLITGSEKRNWSGSLNIFKNILEQTTINNAGYYVGDINKDGILTVNEAFLMGGFDALSQEGYIYPLNDTSEICRKKVDGEVCNDSQKDLDVEIYHFTTSKYGDIKIMTTDDWKVKLDNNNNILTFTKDEGSIAFKIEKWEDIVFILDDSATSNKLKDKLGLNWGEENVSLRDVRKVTENLKFWSDLGIYFDAVW